MRTTTLSLPELFLVAGTRLLLGAGLGLLLGPKLDHQRKQTAGVLLTTIGLLSTVPLAFQVFGKSEPAHGSIASSTTVGR